MGEHNNESSLVHRTPRKTPRHTPPKAENVCKNIETTQNQAKKGPSGRQRPPPPPPGGVGAVEDRFPAVDQHRTHTSTRGGSRFHVPKVRRKGAPNAHPGPGLHGWTLRKNIRKDQKSVHFSVRTKKQPFRIILSRVPFSAVSTVGHRYRPRRVPGGVLCPSNIGRRPSTNGENCNRRGVFYRLQNQNGRRPAPRSMRNQAKNAKKHQKAGANEQKACTTSTLRA